MRKTTEAIAMNEEQPMGEKKGAMKRGGEGQTITLALQGWVEAMEQGDIVANERRKQEWWDERARNHRELLAAAPAMKRDQLDTQQQAENDGDRTLDGLHEVLDAHRHEQYNLRCGCTCGWGTRLIGAEEGYQLWIAHVAERLSETAATPTEPPNWEFRSLTANEQKALRKIYSKLYQPNGKRDLDGLRELIAKWRDDTPPECTCGDNGYFHAGNCPKYRWKCRRSSDALRIERACADELEAALAAQRDPLDTPSKHDCSMAIAALGRRLYEKSWNEYSANDCQKTTRVAVLYDLATELAGISRALATPDASPMGEKRGQEGAAEEGR